jgi:DNA-binding winged helix-turn-helix (wHTH) protein/tetratricopeptide (TPR) repeat protein
MPQSSSETRGYRFGAFELDLVARELRKKGRRLKLQEQPFRVLASLLQSYPDPLSREDLRKQLWDEDTFVEFDHGLSNAIARIRETLGDSSSQPHFIETLPKLGYRFIAPIEPTSHKTKPKVQTVRTSAYAIAAETRTTVAVVPLQFENAAPEDRFLSVALAQTVATRLGSCPQLIIRPVSSAMKYRGKPTDWSQIARELNVDLVVEGSIQKQGGLLRTLIQVWDRRSDQSLHSAKIDGETSALFSLQDRLAESVFEALVPRAAQNRIDSIDAARHPLAFDLYMRSIEPAAFIDKFELSAAIEMLGRALEIDSSFADAWALLANASYMMGAHIDADPKWFNQSEQAIARTLELDPVNGDAHCARGMLLWSPSRGFQFRPALRALNTALKIKPNHHLGRAHRAAVLFHAGFHEAAEDDEQEALLLSPGFAFAYIGACNIAMYRLDYQRAKQLVARALMIEPTAVLANMNAPAPYIYLGELEKAREKLKKARQMTPGEPHFLSMEGLILAQEGDFKRAEQLADETVAIDRSTIHMHHGWHYAAGVYGLCCKPEKAIFELKRCAENGLPNYRLFETDPFLASLHAHPDFIELMRRLRRDYDSLQKEFGLSETQVRPPAAH